MEDRSIRTNWCSPCQRQRRKTYNIERPSTQCKLNKLIASSSAIDSWRHELWTVRLPALVLHCRWVVCRSPVLRPKRPWKGSVKSTRRPSRTWSLKMLRVITVTLIRSSMLSQTWQQHGLPQSEGPLSQLLLSLRVKAPARGFPTSAVNLFVLVLEMILPRVPRDET